MTTKAAEIIYFPKPCPYCKEPLFRVQKISRAWSECRNQRCDYILKQIERMKGSSDLVSYEPYAECFNRR